jgi:hypothetical protein
MSGWQAFGHFAGAFILMNALGIALIFFSAWVQERRKNTVIADLAVEMGVPEAALDTSEHNEEILKYYSDRYSPELLRNRISDLCGLIYTGWGWLGVFLTWAFFFWVIYVAVTDDASFSIAAWGGDCDNSVFLDNFRFF